MKRLLSQFNKDLFQIKAELLCLGVSTYDPKVLKVNPYFNETHYIHGTQLILEKGITANIAVNEKSVRENSPFTVSRYYGSFILYKNDEPQSVCEPIKAPRWYSQEVDKRTKISDIIRLHSYKTLFCVPVKKCIFSKPALKCKFCTYSSNDHWDACYAVETVEKAFRRIFSEQADYEIAIGAATPNVTDFGAEYYAEIIKRIKTIGDFAVSLEIIPPRTNNHIDVLCDAGVDSLIMNLEIFDDTLRKKLCPGKSQVSKERYYEAWEYALKRLGKNKVSSVLIVGLEDKDSTVRGCKEMVSRGVIPTLIPFKPYDQCELSALHPTNVDDYMYAIRLADNLVYAAGLCPEKQEGCTKCGGCTLLPNLAKEVKNA